MLVEYFIHFRLPLGLDFAHAFLMIFQALLLGHQPKRTILFENILKDNFSFLHQFALMVHQVHFLRFMDSPDCNIPAQIESMDNMAIISFTKLFAVD